MPWNPPNDKRREEILSFIVGYIDLHQFPPSIREIQEATKILSSSTVAYYLKTLEKRGLIELVPNISRGIRVPEDVKKRFFVAYKCLYPFGCKTSEDRPGDCRIHGTELVPFVTRR